MFIFQTPANMGDQGTSRIARAPAWGDNLDGHVMPDEVATLIVVLTEKRHLDRKTGM